MRVAELRVIRAAELLVPVSHGTFDGATLPQCADDPVCFTAASVLRLYDALMQLEELQRGNQNHVTEEKCARHHSTMDDLVPLR